MDTFFNLDNPIWRFMGKVADLMLLNVLAIICSIPIFTIGASWTALYYVTIRMVRKEESYIIKDFFHSFKQNFKQATIIWLIALAVIGLLVADILIYKANADQIPKAIMIIIMIVAYLVLGTVIYVFPILSRFYNTVKGTIKNAFLLSMAKFPYTIVFAVVLVVPLIVELLVIQVTPLILFVGFSLPAYICSMLFARIFRRFEPEQVTEDEMEMAEEDSLE